MHILALTRYAALGASSRVRFYHYLPHLRAAGLDVRVAPLFDDAYVRRLYARRPARLLPVAAAYVRRVGWLLRAHRFARLWIESELLPWLPAAFERLLTLLGISYVVDYDDAIFHRYDAHPAGPVRALLGRKIDVVMRSASVVMAGNRYLAERARRAGARHVALVPTVVDVERYQPPAVSAPDRPFLIGWIGSPSTVHYLEGIVPALRAVCREGKAAVRLIGTSLDGAAGLPVESRPWIEDREVDELGAFDVGIMPLHDGPWERGKCGYKLIQYMACGRPVVASPVGANLDIVTHGEHGLFASTVDEWIDALDTLRRDANLREHMGRAGRRRVVEQYSLQAWAPRVAALLRGDPEP
ncbi:MAG: glycosyltransferase family 4 protein [Armatimonadota bacterium]|nr:glycosyltransferase family 4 protein [Armatimonadota bacterium]